MNRTLKKLSLVLVREVLRVLSTIMFMPLEERDFSLV
jgi:hypothetical protein